MAEPAVKEENHSDDIIYGVIDGFYPEESRLVVNDMSINYNEQSLFKNLFGRKLSGSEKKLADGTTVKYRVIHKGSKQFIQKLEVIPKSMYLYEKNKPVADEY